MKEIGTIDFFFDDEITPLLIHEKHIDRKINISIRIQNLSPVKSNTSQSYKIYLNLYSPVSS